MTMIASDIRRTVVGLGATGLSVARYLAARGLSFSLADSRESPSGKEAFLREFPQVPTHFGAFAEQQFIRETELYVNPGIPLSTAAIAAAAAAGARISGDLDCFAREAKAPVIAITGSNGKSTVTTLVAEMARDAGKRVAVGGNLGTPMLELLNAEVELYVLELSSFQLERSSDLAAEVATVLNVSADHLDHHGSMLNYHQAKHRIFRNCEKVVINADDTLTTPLVPDDVEKWYFSLSHSDFRRFGLIERDGEVYLALAREALLPVKALKIAGRHNIANALAALALGSAVGLPMPAMLETLQCFPGLPHRCEYVAECAGVRWYNDSKGTNVGAAVAAMQGLSGEGRIVLIAGGQAKGADLQPLADCLIQTGRAAVLIGEAAETLAGLLGSRLPHRICRDMNDAVTVAAELAQAGDKVLLSPGCASFDMFAGYADRGEQFAAAVHRLAQGGDE